MNPWHATGPWGNGLKIEDVIPSNPRSIAGDVLVDWGAAGVSIGTPTVGWSVTVDNTVTYNGFPSLKVHTSDAAPGGGTTLTVTLTIPSTNFGPAKRLGFAVRPGNRYQAAGASYPVQFWLPSSGGLRLYAVPGDYMPDQEWGEYVADQGDYSTLWNFAGSPGGNWAAGDTDRTYLQLVMQCQANGISSASPVYISPIFADVGQLPAIVSLFMDGPYPGQYKYLRPLLKAFDFRATIGTVVPALLAADASYMTLAQFYKMLDAGHPPIHHTGAGLYGSIYDWSNTTKYPDATVGAAIQADIAASWAQFRAWGATGGIGYGGVAWGNGIAPASGNLARRLAIIAAARAAGMVKMAHSDTFRGPYHGNKDNGLMANSIMQFAPGGALTAGLTRLHEVCARGGWTGYRIHDLVTSAPSGTQTSVADITYFLEALADAVSQKRCVVLPFPEAMRYLDKASLVLKGGY